MRARPECSRSLRDGRGTSYQGGLRDHPGSGRCQTLGESHGVTSHTPPAGLQSLRSAHRSSLRRRQPRAKPLSVHLREPPTGSLAWRGWRVGWCGRGGRARRPSAPRAGPASQRSAAVRGVGGEEQASFERRKGSPESDRDHGLRQGIRCALLANLATSPRSQDQILRTPGYESSRL